MTVEYSVNAYENNQVNLYAVEGEADSRTIIFNIIEKSGTVAATSNAVPENKMLDLTGYSVNLTVLNAEEATVPGEILNAGNGKVQFTLSKACSSEPGSFKCVIILTKNNEDLRIVGITLVVQFCTAEVESIDPKEYGCNGDIVCVIPRATNYFFKFNLIPDFNTKWLEASKRSPILPFDVGDKVIFELKKYPSDTGDIIRKIRSLTDNETTSTLTKSGNFGVELSNLETDIEPGIYYFSVAAKFARNGFYEIVPPSPLQIRKMMIKETDFLKGNTYKSQTPVLG